MMFRYIALAWDRRIGPHGRMARRLGQGLLASPAWRPERMGPGLDLFTTGSRRGVNGAYSLGNDRAVVVGKLFRRADLGQEPTADIALRPDEVDRILRSGGRALIDEFWGRYVAFVLDDAGKVRIVRDPGGALPCFRLEHRGVSIVFSWLEDVLATMPAVPPPAVCDQGLAAHILLGRIGSERTALAGVTRILPGQAIDIGDPASPAPLLWNAADLARQVDHADPAMMAPVLRRTVRACTRDWAHNHRRLLLRLSGGVDSSILLSALDEANTRAEVICLNDHSPGADGDERPYARLAAERARRQLIERERDPHVQLERCLDVARMPDPVNYIGRIGSGHSDATTAAQLGARTLFTGAGGDQLFFEFRCCWPAADHLRNRGVDAAIAGALFDAARLGKTSVWQALRAAIADRLRPSDAWSDAGCHLALVNKEALPGPSGRMPFVHPVLRPGHGLPVGKLHQTAQLLQPLDVYDPYERETAPDFVHPLLSQPLVELCLRTPTYVLTHGGRGRGLARLAFANDLPAPIRDRRAKGGIGEQSRLLLRNNLDFARQLLLDGELVRRGLLDRARAEAMLKDSATATGVHIAEVHLHIGTEAWLQRWMSVGGRAAGRPPTMA